MENSKQNEIINSKISKEIKTSLKNENAIGLSNIKMSLKDFPTLHTLYDSKYNMYFTNNNTIIKRSTTEDFKQNTNSSNKIDNKIFFNEKNVKKNQNKTKMYKFNKNKKFNHKTNLGQNKKKYINNKEKNNKNDILNSIPKNINRDCLVNVVTVKQAKELKKMKNKNFSDVNYKNDSNEQKPKIKKFENIEIIQVNNESINIEPKSKIFSNVEFIHQFDKQIAPITNRRFKNLEMKQESEEKININRIKRFDNIDIYHTENDLHFIDIKNKKDEIVNNTINENITYENIENKISSKNILKNNNSNDEENNLNNRKFINLEIAKSIEKLFISSNKQNLKESILNFEENKEDNNNKNIENIQLLNNNNINNIQNKEEIIINSELNPNINDKKDDEFNIVENEENNHEKSLSQEIEEFGSNKQSQINQKYLQDNTNNTMNNNLKKINYSQINNKYDSDSKIDNSNNISSIDRKFDNSSIDPIQMDSQNYSKLFEGMEKCQLNIYSNQIININNNVNNNIISQENKNPVEIKDTNEKNCITFKENNTNNSNKINNSNNNSKSKPNILSLRKKENNQKIHLNKINNQKDNRRNSEKIKTNNVKKEMNDYKSNYINNRYYINSYSNNNDIFTDPNKIKEKDKNSEQTLSEKNEKVNKYLSNGSNYLLKGKVNNLNKIPHGNINNINYKKLKASSEKMMNNKSKIKESSFNSNPNLSKNSFLKDSIKSTEKQEFFQ
jgi:hypothetical protein